MRSRICLGSMAQIGQPGEAPGRREQVIRPVGEEKRHGIVRVVRHGEALDLEIAEAKAGAGLEALPVGVMLQNRPGPRALWRDWRKP